MNIFDANQAMAELARQRESDAIAQNNFMLQNRQQQEQQNFQNQGILRTRSLEDQAAEAARNGNIDAIHYMLSKNQEQNGPEGTMTGPNGSGTFIPDGNGGYKRAQLRPGETPITAGFSSGVSPAEISNTSVAGQPMTVERLAQSLDKQNPNLKNNPDAFFAALDRVKTLYPEMDTKNLDLAKFRFEQQKYANQPEREKEIAQAKEQGKNAGDAKQVSLGAKDVLNTYQLLKDSVTKSGTNLPSGALESGIARAANYLNIPTEGSKEQATFDANLNNLYLATIRTLKGTGRVMQSELQNIEKAQPKPNDSNAVKEAKLNAHMKYYENRMRDLGFDPATGQSINTNNQQTAPTPQAQPPINGARLAPNGKYYIPDPQRPGKYLQVD